MKNKNKKASHVGMILSFVIFITFTVFVYTLISPNINTAESKKTLLNEIGLSLIDNMSSDFSTISVNIMSNPETNCVRLSEFLFSSGIMLSEFAETENIEDISINLIIKNETYQIQNSYSDLDANFSISINRANPSNTFLRIYHSPELDSLPENEITPCSSVPFESNASLNRGYQIGSVFSGSYIFEKNMISLVDYYRADYDKLKTELKISPGNEFGFEFTLSNGTKISAIGDLPTQNIYAEDIPVQYIDDDANILSGFINVKVW
jgi:hypothetical protein